MYSLWGVLCFASPWHGFLRRCRWSLRHLPGPTFFPMYWGRWLCKVSGFPVLYLKKGWQRVACPRGLLPYNIVHRADWRAIWSVHKPPIYLRYANHKWGKGWRGRILFCVAILNYDMWTGDWCWKESSSGRGFPVFGYLRGRQCVRHPFFYDTIFRIPLENCNPTFRRYKKGSLPSYSNSSASDAPSWHASLHPRDARTVGTWMHR